MTEPWLKKHFAHKYLPHIARKTRNTAIHTWCSRYNGYMSPPLFQNLWHEPSTMPHTRGRPNKHTAPHCRFHSKKSLIHAGNSWLSGNNVSATPIIRTAQQQYVVSLPTCHTYTASRLPTNTTSYIHNKFIHEYNMFTVEWYATQHVWFWIIHTNDVTCITHV